MGHARRGLARSYRPGLARGGKWDFSAAWRVVLAAYRRAMREARINGGHPYRSTADGPLQAPAEDAQRVLVSLARDLAERFGAERGAELLALGFRRWMEHDDHAKLRAQRYRHALAFAGQDASAILGYALAAAKRAARPTEPPSRASEPPPSRTRSVSEHASPRHHEEPDTRDDRAPDTPPRDEAPAVRYAGRRGFR